MEWETFFQIINTADTILGVLFLTTSWLVGRSWWRSHHAQARREAMGAAPATSTSADADERSDAGEGL